MKSKLEKFNFAYAKIVKEMSEAKTSKRLIKEQSEGKKYWKVAFGLQDPIAAAQYNEFTYEEYKEDLGKFLEAFKEYASDDCHGDPMDSEWWEVKAYVPEGKLMDFLSIKTVGGYSGSDDDIYTILYSINQTTPDEFDGLPEEDLEAELNEDPNAPVLTLVDSAPAATGDSNAVVKKFMSEEYKKVEQRFFSE